MGSAGARTRLGGALARQEDVLLARADAAAAAADRAVRRVWFRIIEIAKSGGGWHRVYLGALAALRQLPRELAGVGEDLARAAAAGHRDAAAAVAGHLPRRAARALLRRRGLLEDEGLAALVAEYILPGPDAETVRRIVYATDWPARMARLTSLAAPEALAATLAQSLASGDAPARAARKIRPVLQGVQASARRVARTEGLRVAHEARLEAYEQLGDLVVGYRVHAVLDGATRKEHRQRHGTEYFREPKPGQKGFGEMPRPPLEADGRVAHNCRCWLEPILAAD